MGQAPQLNTAPDLKITKPAKTFQSNEDVFAGLSVLLVEDCVDLQVLMSHYLKQYGAEFCIAENGVAALNCAKDHSFDLILMDIQMPVMNGYQCTHKLRESGYNGRIFALTAHATEDEKIRVLRSGFDAYFSKPLDWSDLSNTIRQSASNGDSGHNSLPSVLIPRRRSALSNGMSGKPITLL
jgi:CheY-like chemotaxis protein